MTVYRAKMARTKSWRRERQGDLYVPTVPTAQEVLDKAFKGASTIDAQDPSAIYRAKKNAMSRVDSVSDTIAVTLGRVVKSMSLLDRLHPFYEGVLATQFDIAELRKSVATVDWCRGQVAVVCRKASMQLARTKNRKFIEQKRKEVYGRVSSLLERISGELALLGTVRDAMRSLDAIDPAVPTVVVAGYPNVGKSALVGRLSTAEPAVAAYPFTTTRVTVGHFFHRSRAFQVVDTPGLLDRPIEERNPVERRALAAIAHLPAMLLFLVDPTGEGGTTLEAQERLLEEIRAAYPGKDVLVIETKADLVRREGGDRPRVSSVTGEGIDALKAELIKRLPQPEIEWVIREG